MESSITKLLTDFFRTPVNFLQTGSRSAASRGAYDPPGPHRRAVRGQRRPNGAQEVNCQELLEQLGDYLDEEARQELCREIEEHLERCNDCRIVVDQTRKTIVLYQADQQVELPGLAAASSRLTEAMARAYGEGSKPSD